MAAGPQGELYGVDSLGGRIVRISPDGSVEEFVQGLVRPTALAVLPDGKILAAGRSSTSGPNFAVARFNENGSLDTTFNAPDGFRSVDFGGNDFARSIALQADGKILVAGSTDAPGNNDFAVMRLTKEGQLDRIETEIALTGALSEPQRARLLEMAGRCPVHRTLTSEIDIQTRLA